MQGKVKILKENVVSVLVELPEGVQITQGHMLHWEATPLVTRKPAWGLGLTVTISQDELVTQILPQARLLSPNLVEVGFTMEKMVPWSHGSQRNHKVGVIWVSGQLCDCHDDQITILVKCNAPVPTFNPPSHAMGCLLGVLKGDWLPHRLPVPLVSQCVSSLNGA